MHMLKKKKKTSSPPGVGCCIVWTVGGAIRNHCKTDWALPWSLTASCRNKRVWCWRRRAGRSITASCLILPWNFFLGSEGTSRGGCAALGGGKRAGVYPAVGGCALKVSVDLQVASRSGSGADFVPLLIALR